MSLPELCGFVRRSIEGVVIQLLHVCYVMLTNHDPAGLNFAQVQKFLLRDVKGSLRISGMALFHFFEFVVVSTPPLRFRNFFSIPFHQPTLYSSTLQ